MVQCFGVQLLPACCAKLCCNAVLSALGTLNGLCGLFISLAELLGFDGFRIGPSRLPKKGGNANIKSPQPKT